MVTAARHCAVPVLLVYTLHNAWNCWMFLNFTNFDPAEELLQVGETEIGAITTAGWLGMLPAFPIAVVCNWHRSLLAVAGLLNVLAPVIRYFAVRAGVYSVVLLTNVMLGSAFGVLGVWPAMLAAMYWPEKKRAGVIAVAVLSNYVGGAAGVLFFPTYATTAAELLEVFRIQAIAAAVLGCLMLTWCWLPPFHEGVTAMKDSEYKALEAPVLANSVTATPTNANDTANDTATTASSAANVQQKESHLTIKEELSLCCRGLAPYQVVCFGILVGVSLSLQGISPYIFTGVGFSAVNSGLSNFCYQLSAAVIGVGLGTQIQNERHVRMALRGLHAVLILSILAILILCLLARANGVSQAESVIVVVLMIFLGGSLMGALPFCIQQLLYTASPVSENVASGCLYLIAAPLAAAITQLSTVLSPVAALILMCALLALEGAMFLRFGPPKLATE